MASCCETTRQRGAVEAQTGFVALSKRNTLALNAEACINCGMCSAVCPHGVFTPGARGTRRVQIMRADACMECGACMLNCPTGALFVDSGVGCAAAMINAALRGVKNSTCSASEPTGCCG